MTEDDLYLQLGEFALNLDWPRGAVVEAAEMFDADPLQTLEWLLDNHDPGGLKLAQIGEELRRLDAIQT